MVRYIDFLGLTGNGGFDFLITKDGSVRLVDPNLGRDTGALPLRKFEKINSSIDKKSMIFVKIPAVNINCLESFLCMIEQNGINLYTKDYLIGCRIIPISFVSGKHLTIIITGDSLEQIQKGYSVVKKTAEKIKNSGELEKSRKIKSAGELIDY